MNPISRGILLLAIAYTAVVAAVDSFLGNIPIVNWLALGIVFVFFTAMILDSATKLLVASRTIAKKVQEKQEDELDRLERLIERALGQGQAEPLMILEKRLISLVIASAYQSGQFNRQIPQTDKFNSQSFSSTAQEDLTSLRLTDYSLVPEKLRSREIESLLSMIEDWLS
jgi:hypothetical protein